MQQIDNVWIPLADGTRLATRLWLPDDAGSRPVPAILEYLPYRKSDGTAVQDLTRHPYFAQHGFAGVRVDIRGSGDSDGIIKDEYSRQEHDDALEVIAWIAEQPWCTGSVGMIGYSWGGFNGLQIAARRPPALKAVVTMYSTDDRYRDDCHYMGGCLLASDMLKWATAMRAYNALPPDPAVRDDWREVWTNRLAETPAFIEPWLSHQSRDDYWLHGSVAADYGAIEAATLVVGGWTDAYTNSVPRLLEHLTCARKAIIGPWAHVVPYAGVPGPAIDFLSECVRWFGRWLADEPTGVESDPDLRAWIGDSVAPDAGYEDRPGRWIAVSATGLANALRVRLGLGDGMLAPVGEGGRPLVESPVVLDTPLSVGETAGVWCVNGMPHELPIDQRADDALSVCFDTEPLQSAWELLGTPVLEAMVSCDAPVGNLVARLCDVAPDGTSTLLSWGQLNLNRALDDSQPMRLDPDVALKATLSLNALGCTVPAGHRLRLALSNTYWPHVWPAAYRVALEIDRLSAVLTIPLLPSDAVDAPEAFTPAPVEQRGLRPGDRERVIEDTADGAFTILDRESGATQLPGGTLYETQLEDFYSIMDDQPLSPMCASRRLERLSRDGWDVVVQAESLMTCTRHDFEVTDRLRAWDGDECVWDVTHEYRIARDNL